jgi:hypothetical protein
MPKMMDAETERQLIGIRKATAHARRMYEQGIISHDELNRVQTYALEQRMLKFLDVETYKAARENGDWDQFGHRARRLRYVHINVTCVASRTPSTRAAAGSSARSGAHSSFMATRPARRTSIAGANAGKPVSSGSGSAGRSCASWSRSRFASAEPKRSADPGCGGSRRPRQGHPRRQTEIIGEMATWPILPISPPMIRRRRRHNDREAGVTDKQHCDGLGPIIPESDEIIFPPNRRLIIQAGKLARAEQERLEREYRLRDGRRPKTEDPGGYFQLTKAPAGLQEPSPRTYAPPGFLFFWEFFIQAPQRRLAHELEERRH